MVAGKVKVPLKQQELEHLEKVISDLEQKTSGEIRLMIVKSSIVTGHIFFMLFGWLASAVLFFVWIERHHFIWMASWWLVPSALVVTALVSWALSKIPAVIRAVTPVRDLRRQVVARAELEFYFEGLGATGQGTGILLFFSLLEHQAVVLADKGIASRLESNIWNEVVATMLEGPRTGKWADRLEKALRQCGALLAQHFPIEPGDRNELPNLVIVKA